MLNRLSLLALFLVLASCQTTNVPPLEIGKPAGSAFQYADRTIPLPDGNWVIAAEERSRNNGGAEIGNVVLVDLAGGQVRKAVHIQTNLSQASFGRGWALDSQCDRQDVYFIERRANYDGGEQACELVSHYRFGITNKSPAYFRDALAFLKKHNAVLPDTAIYSRFRRADTMNMLTVFYFYNPDIEGITPTSQIGWSESDWNTIRVDRFPDKKAYIEKIKNWTIDWRSKIAAK
ncbi:MAG: hypothetical protein HYU59_06425 [Magnetospirillum gryphiswaldense]|nr:hypothetical protein [Magnetospirillum gryphiswaldense]